MTVTLGLPLPLPPFFDFANRVPGGLIGKGLELLTSQQVIEYWLNVLRVTPGQYWPRLTPQIPNWVLGAIGLLLALPDRLADGTFGPGMTPPFVLEPGIEPENLLPGIQYTYIPDPANPDKWYYFYYTEDLYKKWGGYKSCETGEVSQEDSYQEMLDYTRGGPTMQGTKFRYKVLSTDCTYYNYCKEGAYNYTGPVRRLQQYTTWNRSGSIYNNSSHSVVDSYTDVFSHTGGSEEKWTNFRNVEAQEISDGKPVGPRIPLTSTPDPGYGEREPAPGTRNVPMRAADTAAALAPAPGPSLQSAFASGPADAMPLTEPAVVPMPLPGDFPVPQVTPATVPVPPAPVTLPAAVPATLPATTTATTPDGLPVPAPAQPITQTEPGTHYPWEGSGPVTGKPVPPTLEGIAAEVGRIEQKVAKIGGATQGLNPLDLIDAINDLQELLEGLQGDTEYPSDTYRLTGVCEELNDDGEQPVFSTPVLGGIWPVAALSRLDAIQYLLQAHLGYKTPTCGSTKPKLEGDWVTVRFESDQNSPAGQRPLRKLLRYRTKSGADLGTTTEYWSDFTWQAGPVIVSHKGGWWGTPQVWARSADEGKRVLRHAAREAGIDPDQDGQWVISGSRDPRYGMPGTMRVAQVSGLDWVTKRDGPSALPDLAVDP